MSAQRRAAQRDGRAGIDGVSRWMGMRWDSADTVRLEIRPEYCMGSTLWKETAPDEAIATVSISINYVATATEGEIVCRTTLDRRNRRLATMRSEVVTADGRLLCTAIGSFTIFPRKDT